MKPRSHTNRYPRQFWWIFIGVIISTTGTTMIWPFLMIFVSERLQLPLTAVTSLMTISAAAGLVSSVIAGPIIDRYGRKRMMVIGLLGNGLMYLLYTFANTYWHFALILSLAGVFSPFYRVGTDAMLADMFEPQERVNAYATFRMGRNIGVALGPALGGFVLSQSYRFGLFGAAGALILYGLLVLFFVHETYHPVIGQMADTLRSQISAYLQAFRNAIFMHLVGAFTLVQLCASMVWVMLSVYLKQNFAIPESSYAWIPTTNALMVVFFQLLITRLTLRHKPTQVMAFGGIFYAAAMALIAFSNNYWGFWAAMVVMTLGELIIVPTSSAYVANCAPPDKRGRYMSLFGLTWNVATGISPLAAGILSDTIGVRAPWMVGIVIGVLSVLAFLSLRRREAATHGTPPA